MVLFPPTIFVDFVDKVEDVAFPESAPEKVVVVKVPVEGTNLSAVELTFPALLPELAVTHTGYTALAVATSLVTAKLVAFVAVPEKVVAVIVPTDVMFLLEKSTVPVPLGASVMLVFVPPEVIVTAPEPVMFPVEVKFLLEKSTVPVPLGARTTLALLADASVSVVVPVMEVIPVRVGLRETVPVEVMVPPLRFGEVIVKLVTPTFTSSNLSSAFCTVFSDDVNEPLKLVVSTETPVAGEVATTATGTGIIVRKGCPSPN